MRTFLLADLAVSTVALVAWFEVRALRRRRQRTLSRP
jgi:hypothetical protein